MSTEPLVVHSLTEASLYLALVPCGACGGGVVPQVAPTCTEDSETLSVPIICRKCNEVGVVRFDLQLVDVPERAGGFAALVAAAEAGDSLPISRTDEPSRVIDVAGWLTLHARLCDAARAKARAASSVERTLARQLHIQAAACLEEALKFYDEDNDLPPEDAFFTDAGRRQFRGHPESFLRGRLVSLRAVLPVARQL